VNIGVGAVVMRMAGVGRVAVLGTCPGFRVGADIEKVLALSFNLVYMGHRQKTLT
jgi:hypothetical protein